MRDPDAPDLDRPPLADCALHLRGREPGANQLDDEVFAETEQVQYVVSAAAFAGFGNRLQGAAVVGGELWRLCYAGSHSRSTSRLRC
jgi:uncharacterized RmlC-like cupin family protein